MRTVLENYYDILGVSRDATPDEIRAAYRRLAKQYHPDINSDPQANERFLAIQQAYETLINPDARARYDMMLDGHPGVQHQKPFGYRGSPGGGMNQPSQGFSWSWQMPDSGIARLGFIILILIGGVLILCIFLVSFLYRAVVGDRRKRQNT